MKENIQLMRDAKASLKGKWSNAALAYLILFLVICASSFLIIGSYIVAGPMMVGFIFYMKQIRNGEQPKLESLFNGFNDFLRAFLGYFLAMIFIALWSMLLFIPGIIKVYSYAMTPFVIADEEYDGLSANEAINRSMDIMRGKKWKLFCLQMRFFGWMMLAMLTCGILLFWVVPYVQMATLNFYEDAKAEWKSRLGIQA